MNILNIDIEDTSKKNSVKLIIEFLVVAALIYCAFYASWWSFQQTMEFLTPAFEKKLEVIVFSIFIQYGPQPALFYIALFRHRLATAQRSKNQWAANNGEEDIPLDKIDAVYWNTAYLFAAVLFFFALSTIDFLTNLGQVNTTAENENIKGLLYGVMVSFAFLALWAEELAGNLFVFFFSLLEGLAIMFGFNNMSFIKAQVFFKNLSGRTISTPISGQRPRQLYPSPTAQSSSIYRKPIQRQVYRSPVPKPTSPIMPFDGEKPTYHPVSYSARSQANKPSVGFRDLLEEEEEDKEEDKEEKGYNS